MKPVLTAITAAIFASALALPAFAQVGSTNADSASSTTTTSTSSDSTRNDGANAVNHSERSYSSDRTDKIGGSMAPAEKVERHVEKKESMTTSGEVPAPMTERSTTTTRHEETQRSNTP